MKAFKTIALNDVLTPSEIARVRTLYREQSDESFNSRLVRELVEPNKARINAALGQEMDSRYVGYAIEYCLMARPSKARAPKRDKLWTRRKAAHHELKKESKDAA